jgi:hypothetical protein
MLFSWCVLWWSDALASYSTAMKNHDLLLMSFPSLLESSWIPNFFLEMSFGSFASLLLLLLHLSCCLCNFLFFQILLVDRFFCWPHSTSASIYPLWILQVSLLVVSARAVFLAATLHATPWVGCPNIPCFFHPLWRRLATLLQTPIPQSHHSIVVQLFLLTNWPLSVFRLALFQLPPATTCVGVSPLAWLYLGIQLLVPDCLTNPLVPLTPIPTE